MKFNLIFLVALIAFVNCDAQNSSSASGKSSTNANKTIPSKDIQIKSALMAAPTEKREGCAVMGYDTGGKLVMLRDGTNELICLADDPNAAGFSVACYAKDLEPFMKRGRDLRSQGMKHKEVFDQREKDVKEGKLSMPKQPTALYVFSAKDEDYDRKTGEVKNGYLRSVVYIPYATSASTGLPEKPAADGMPWLMDPGTHGAHIMINPKRQ